MIKALLFDLARVLLFPKNATYPGELNALHRVLSIKPTYHLLEHFEFNEPLFEYLDELKKKWDLYMFTSGTIQQAPEIAAKLKSLFKDIFSAEQWQVSKQDPQVYLKIADLLHVKPQEMLFIDDTNSNVEVAKTAGLNGIVYSTFENLKAELDNLLNDKTPSL